MSWPMILACVIFSASLALGQILFKFAAEDIKGRLSDGLIQSVLSPWLVSALLLYGASTALWIWILMHVPISRAYPFALSAMALVPLAGYWLFAESLTPQYAVGFALMLVGLAFIQSG